MLFRHAGRSMGSSTSGSSNPNDDNRYVDKYLVKKLQRERNSVIRLMNDAEEKQFKDRSVKEWLVDIKHTIYDANALLDEIDTEARFREKYKEDSDYSISEFVEGATSKVKRIIEELENMVRGAVAMGLKARDEGAAASDWQTRITSPVSDKSTIGREEEKARILKQVLYSPINKAEEKQFILFPDNIREWLVSIREWLVSIREWILKKVLYSPEPMFAAPGNKPEVIAIVGMGGLGKTTLAKYVYNHADVKRCFTRSWACVSDNFDLVRVTRDILECLTGTAAGVCGLAPLQQQLQEQLKGKRFLIVFDDAWDSSWQNWEDLMTPFSAGATGSKIILTTRDWAVADVATGESDLSFPLEPMSKDETWSLFLCEVLRDGELSLHPKLEAIGKEIVEKCGGSPLAIKTLSGLLRSERKEEEWERVRGSSLWQLPEGQKHIIPALGLSYSFLPSHLKTCFAYCSLFPKDYAFWKNELVNLWIDEGFLQSVDNRSIEDVGVASFEDLSSRSFFTRNYNYLEEVYVMHDLMHDLAQIIFAEFHVQLNGHKAVKEWKKVRHVYFHDHSECSSSSILEDLNQAESLQTFMVQYEPEAPRWDWDGRILEDFLLQRLSLHVLCLRGARIHTLPDTISSLMLLRCLDVSYTDVEELPASLCKLYNLRRLLCESCDQIEEFHYDMAAFVSLRHFTLSGRQVTLSGRQLQKAPWNLSQLSQVTLGFQVTLESDSNHTESGLDNSVVHVSVIIDRSTFRYSRGDAFMDLLVYSSTRNVQVRIDKSTFLYSSTGEDAFIDSYFLESSRPHRDLKEVRIRKFKGKEFPGWLVDRSYRYIEKVELVRCWISSGLMPALGGLPSLKHLRLEGVKNVKKLGSELYISTDSFGSLEELRFEDMEEWEEWEPSDDAAGGICFFPGLQKLSIVSCHKLKGRLPSNLPSLKELDIESCSSLVELNDCHRKVVDLRIIDCGPHLANSCLVDMRLGMFPHLQRLVIGDCDSFESFPAEDSLPTSLTYLQIRRFARLKKLDVFWLRSLTNLEELVIDYCPLLESLSYSSDADDCSSDEEFSFNSSFRKLVVRSCVNLKTINGAWLRSLISLRELYIEKCLEFEPYFPEVGLPRSLTELHLRGIKNIRRQDWIVIQNLTSLEELKIYCRKLKALPVKLPRSLKKLMVLGNHRGDLKDRCKRNTGLDWPNIAHVPDIDIS